MGIISNLVRNITKKTLTGGNRQDKQFQSDFQKAVDSGKKVSVNDVKSSRWQYDKSNSLYDDKDVADKDIEKGDLDSPIKENSVSSTCVDSFDYDPKTGDLDIKFRGGDKKYTYPNVPPEVVKEFMDSPSIGKAFHELIEPYSANR